MDQSSELPLPTLAQRDFSVGDKIKILGEEWEIVADDSANKLLRKEWDYVVRNLKTGEVKKYLREALRILVQT